jgi:hypothetical protein
MNYQKLDAALSAAMSSAAMSVEALSDEPRFSVSVRTLAPPDLEQQRELASLGVYDVSSRGRVFSAQLSPSDVSALSHKPWIRLLSLAQELKPLG